MKKSTLLMVLGLVLCAMLGIGGTIAYLTDSDADVNVMTLGNVNIEQNELERIEQSDKNTATSNLKTFAQNKPLYPAVGSEGLNSDAQNWPAGGSNNLLSEEMKNVVDKFVFVENTGKSDAYVRTVFAFEAGTLSQQEWYEMIHLHTNSDHWQWNPTEIGASDDYAVVIDGNRYYLAEAIYVGGTDADGDVHKGGILPPGETTRPSLMQIWLDSKADNATVEALDGNGNGTYDILVVSQAVQVQGFGDPETALDAAFEDITVADNPWKKDGADLADTPVFPVLVGNAAELEAALAAGGQIVLTDDVTLSGEVFSAANPAAVIDLGGHTITADQLKFNGDITLENGRLVHAPIEVVDERGFEYSGEVPVAVTGGTLTMNNMDIDCDVPCTVKIVTNSTIELVALRVAAGKLVLNDCDITVSNDTYYGALLQAEGLIAIGLEGDAQLEFNGGSITLNGHGARDVNDYLPILSFKNGAKSVLIGGVTFNKDIWLFSAGGSVTVNTTDAAGTWDGKCAGNGCTLQYAK